MERSREPAYRLLDFGLADDDGLAAELGHQVENHPDWRVPAGYTVRIPLCLLPWTPILKKRKQPS